MNYEQKYNEMVQRAKELHESGNALTRQQMEIVCPELAESEDERIRKFLIEKFSKLGEIWPEYSTKTILAYLEKQKEQKPDLELIKRSWYMEGYTDGEFKREPMWNLVTGEGGPRYEKNEKYGQPLEQKPAEWSEEDEEMLNRIEADIRIAAMHSEKGMSMSFKKDIAWLKSLRPSWKPSEEQMEALKKVTGNAVDADEYYPALATLYYDLKEQF